MKILHVATHANSGAGRAASRLNTALNKVDVDSTILSVDSGSGKNSAYLNKGLKLLKEAQSLVVNKYLIDVLKSESIFSVNITPSLLSKTINSINPDIVNLHWIGHEFIQLESLVKLDVPIVWTFHDMWAFTGGCHYTGNCVKYSSTCVSCPQLHGKKEKDLSYWIFNRKKKIFSNLHLNLVTPSHWLADATRSSTLMSSYPITVIPNGIPTDIYKVTDKKTARELLKLPQDKIILLFTAIRPTSDPRKGFHLLNQVLQRLEKTEWKNKIELVILGTSDDSIMGDIMIPTRALGTFHDDLSLSLIYSASDIFVAPSIQDNFPNTVLEASSCGIPTIAFKIGGMSDLITHQETGFLVSPFKIDEFQRGLVWLIENNYENKLGQNARLKVEDKFSEKQQADSYLSLYTKILNESCNFDLKT